MSLIGPLKLDRFLAVAARVPPDAIIVCRKGLMFPFIENI